jgi:hypothetical protein
MGEFDGLLYGSQIELRTVHWMVIVPPYWGVPSLSHQLPVLVVVAVTVGVKVGFGVVVGVKEGVGIVVVEVTLVVVFVVGVDVELDLAQDASSIAATIKRLEHNQIILFFILPP